MKRQKRVIRDREMEQVRAMTTLSLTQWELRERQVADKIALESRLRRLFALRRATQDQTSAVYYCEQIKQISGELRRIKSQLQ